LPPDEVLMASMVLFNALISLSLDITSPNDVNDVND